MWQEEKWWDCCWTSQRLADGFYPTTWVPVLVRKHQRCRLTYTTMIACSTESARGTQQQDNEAANTTLTTLWGGLHPDKRSCLRLRKLSLDTLRLKSLWNVTEATFLDGKERGCKVKSAGTSFEKNSSVRGQENFILSSYSLRIRERGKNASHIEVWVNASATVSRRNHEPQHANRKQAFFADVLRVNHTLRKCRFVHRLLISLLEVCGKPEKANHAEAFGAATWTVVF